MPHPNEVVTVINTGEVAVAAAATQLPDVECRRVKIANPSGNLNTFYVGNEGVTAVSGVSSTTTGWPVVPGTETDWLYVSNLDQLYVRASGPGEALVYLTQL